MRQHRLVHGFTTVGDVTRQKVQTLANEFGYTSSKPSTLIDYPNSEQFSFENTNCSVVKNIITCLPEKGIEDSAPVIVPIITNIINASFKSFQVIGNFLKSTQF